MAVATHKINADIIHPSVANTEAGKGRFRFKGYSTQLEATYVVQATGKVTVSLVVGLRYSTIERSSYTESPTLDFPVVYGKIQGKPTKQNLFVGGAEQTS